jgi:hypothetical protein
VATSSSPRRGEFKATPGIGGRRHFEGKTENLRQGSRAKFLHHRGPMVFNSALTNAKAEGNLLVRLSVRDLVQNLTLARGKGGDQRGRFLAHGGPLI